MAFYLRGLDNMYVRFDIIDGVSDCEIEYATSFPDEKQAQRYCDLLDSYDYDYEVIEVKLAKPEETKEESEKKIDVRYTWFIKDKNEKFPDSKYYNINTVDWNHRMDSTRFESLRDALDIIKQDNLNYGSVKPVVVKVKLR